MTEYGIRAARGGVGEFLPPTKGRRFGLKVVRLLDEYGLRNDGFWHEALSVHSYCSSVRFVASCTKIPLAMRYYIHRSDPLFEATCEHCRKPLKLDKLLFEACGIKSVPEKFRDYEPIPEGLLRRIYDENLSADLLLFYPVVYGGEKNLTDYYGDDGFSSGDAGGLLRQIASAIMELYRGGTAHGDIKPENIMVSEHTGKKIFRLTDFGSVHSEALPSDTGTNAFFDRDLYDEVLGKTGDKLLARVSTDCYALHRTMLALALGHHPGPLVCKALVSERWPEIQTAWEKLEHIDQIEDVESIAAETPSAVVPDWRPFVSYCDDFDPLLTVDNRLEYGRLYEPIRFSDRFDPMMRICGVRFDSEVWKLFPEFCHAPLIAGLHWKIFHAPDDVTGERPQDFRTYEPKSLANTAASPEEADRLIAYGKMLNEHLRTGRDKKAYLLRPEDIFWCDGKLKMLWGMGKTLPAPIDYEAYFRFLVTGKAHLKAEDWLILLPRLPLLQNELDRNTALKLLARFSRDLGCAWLWGIRTFTEHIAGIELEFDARDWLALREYTDEFDAQIDAGTAWEMFHRVSGKATKKLLASPHIAALLRATLPPGTDGKLYFKDFLRMRQCDEATFLRYFPPEAREAFSVKQWQQCLQTNPELKKFVPERVWPLLSCETWERILKEFPDMVEKSPFGDRLLYEGRCGLCKRRPQSTGTKKCQRKETEP